jgi:hypothetical protein
LKTSVFSPALFLIAFLGLPFSLAAQAQEAASPWTLKTTSTTLQQTTSQNPVAPQTAAPKCEYGPIKKMYGRASWLVYGCDDNKSLAIVAAPENPAAPFYFVFTPDNGHYHLHGQGSGRNDVTSAAFNELKALTKTDIETLLAETQATKP